MPASKGETYSYVVDKYWIVQGVLDEGQIRLRTRRGKQHVVSQDDPRLRKAQWWQRVLLGARFRAVEESPDSNS